MHVPCLPAFVVDEELDARVLKPDLDNLRIIRRTGGSVG